MLAALGLGEAPGLRDAEEEQQAEDQELDDDAELFADLDDDEIFGCGGSDDRAEGPDDGRHRRNSTTSNSSNGGLGDIAPAVLEEILQRAFGHKSFRGKQEWVVRRCLRGESTLVRARRIRASERASERGEKQQ